MPSASTTETLIGIDSPGRAVDGMNTTRVAGGPGTISTLHGDVHFQVPHPSALLEDETPNA